MKPQEIFSFKEGQFMFLEIPGVTRADGSALKNAYSIGTTSHFLQETGEIGFIVKKASIDGVSDFLTQRIQVGDRVHMKGPLGHFFDKHQSQNYLMISIGSGVTPIVSLYEHLVHESKEYNKIANIFGERYIDEVLPSVRKLFTDEQKTKDSIRHYCCLSREEQPPKGRHTWYVQTQLENALQFLENPNDLHVFLCGKPAMCDEVEQILETHGINKTQCTVEKY